MSEAGEVDWVVVEVLNHWPGTLAHGQMMTVEWVLFLRLHKFENRMPVPIHILNWPVLKEVYFGEVTRELTNNLHALHFIGVTLRISKSKINKCTGYFWFEVYVVYLPTI